jgi:DNA-binding transcriptional regulator YhcF (GntR family)
MIRLHVDRFSPTPLYHQIVQAIRWKIGTGALGAGDPLPPIREAAEEWDVNYHTVRRAYQELAEQGWVESIQGAGTHVADALPRTRESKRGLDRWVEDVLDIGVERFGLSATDLARLIQARQGVSRVVMVECNVHQAATLARQLEDAWLVEAIPWDLDGGAPPQLPIIGTYFHHAEMKRKWPDRVRDMHFVAVRTDPGLRYRIEAAAPGRAAWTLRLIEQDPATAREMATAVTELLPARFTVKPEVGDAERVLRSLSRKQLLLVAPRLWDRLPEHVRNDERVFDVQHTVVPEDLRRVWHSLTSGPQHGARQRR